MTAEENPFAELMAEYVAECLPLAEEVLDRTLLLERAWAGGEEPDEDLRPLRGQLHTLKGNSAMMGLGPLQSLAHLLEDLTGLLDADLSCRTVGAPLLVRGAGLLTDLIRGATAGPIPDLAVQDFVEEGRAFLEGAGGAREIPRSEQREEDRRRVERRTRRSPGEVGGDGSVTTIRVESSRLDALLESFGEAMIAQSGIRDAARRLARGGRPTPEVALLEQSILSLDRTLKRLGGALMASRLLPLSTIFGRFTRQVRDLALAESKRVRLEVAGGETRLDKTIIDRLGEPLVHLMTNAIIHGIESPEEREALGKSGRGRHHPAGGPALRLGAAHPRRRWPRPRPRADPPEGARPWARPRGGVALPRGDPRPGISPRAVDRGTCLGPLGPWCGARRRGEFDPGAGRARVGRQRAGAGNHLHPAAAADGGRAALSPGRGRRRALRGAAGRRHRDGARRRSGHSPDRPPGRDELARRDHPGARRRRGTRQSGRGERAATA